MAMSKKLREAVKQELAKRARDAANKRWEGKTKEEKVAAARSAALAKHRKLGHNMTIPDAEAKDAA